MFLFLKLLCDYWKQKQSGEKFEENSKLEEKLENSGPAIETTCKLLTLGKALLPDNIPPSVPNIGLLMSSGIAVMDLPDIVLRDDRPQPKYPTFDVQKLVKSEEFVDENVTAANITELAFKTREKLDEIPADAYVVIAAIGILIILKLIHSWHKRKERRKKLLMSSADDLQAMKNIAKLSKLTAEEYKLIYETAKRNVEKEDFSKYAKKKERKQEWQMWEEREKNIEIERQKMKQEGKYTLIDNTIVEEETIDKDSFAEFFESESTQLSFDHH